MKNNDCQNMVKGLVNIYHHVRINQLQRYAEYFDLKAEFAATISRLGRSGTYTVSKNVISLRECSFSYAVKVMNQTDKQRLITALEKAFVILTDFFTAMPLVTHFPTYRFPYVLIFATEKEVYEVLYVGKGREQVAEQVMSFKDEGLTEEVSNKAEETISKRIIIVDDKEQIPKIRINNIVSYAVVDEDGGYADYYPVNNPAPSKTCAASEIL